MTIIDLYEIMATDRCDIRSKVVNEFLKENSGSSEETSKYEYNVETYKNYRIVLKRPGVLKKGFDFSVNTRGIYYKKKKRYESPTFDDVITALKYVKKNYKDRYDFVRKEINNIFEVENYELKNVENIMFLDYENNQHPIAVILLAIKWLFIAEDISYWNWSGRNKFMDYLRTEKLV